MADAPVRGPEYEKLNIWICKWRAEGTNYSADGKQSSLVSEESVAWLPGEFFALQEWNEHGSKEPFIGAGVFGYDSNAKSYFVRSFENHGFYRHYELKPDGDVWTFDGPTERARVEFTDGGDTQIIHWGIQTKRQVAALMRPRRPPRALASLANGRH